METLQIHSFIFNTTQTLEQKQLKRTLPIDIGIFIDSFYYYEHYFECLIMNQILILHISLTHFAQHLSCLYHILTKEYLQWCPIPPSNDISKSSKIITILIFSYVCSMKIPVWVILKLIILSGIIKNKSHIHNSPQYSQERTVMVLGG